MSGRLPMPEVPRYERQMGEAKTSRSSVAISIVGIPVGGLVSYFTAKVLDRWGVLDDLANRLGDFLAANIAPSDVATVFGLLIFVGLYGLLLWIVWSRKRGKADAAADQPKLRNPENRSSAQIELHAEARAIARELEGRIAYARRVLDDGSAAELRKWRSKIELQRVPFADLHQADSTELPPEQHEHHRAVLRALDELDRAIDLIVAHPRRFKLAHSAGIFRQRATKARVLMQKFLTAMGDPANVDIPVYRDKGLCEALAYAELGQWGRSYLDALQDGTAVNTFEEFRQRAFDGKLETWGQVDPNGVWMPIERHFWEKAWPRGQCFLKDEATLQNVAPGTSYPIYWNVMVSSTQFEKEWPCGG